MNKQLENIVAVQLNKLYRNTDEDLRLFYYNKGVEVDFCIPERNLAIQVLTINVVPVWKWLCATD